VEQDYRDRDREEELLEAVMDGQADMETNEGVGRRVGCLCCD
jgi:hypothetical protein